MTRRRAWLVLCLLCTVGCSLGPLIVPRTHLGYNEAVRTATTEELLLNIVRLRYLDVPYFLSIDAISAQMGFEIGVTGEFGEVEGDASAAIRPGVTYSDRPTITFRPKADREFLADLATPIGVDTIAYLGAQGVSIDRIISLIAIGVNGLRNDSTGRDADFDRAIELMARLDRRRAIAIGYVEQRESHATPVRANQISVRDLLDAADAGYDFEPVPQKPWMVRLTEPRPVPMFWLGHGTDSEETAAWAQELLNLLRLDPKESVFPVEAMGRTRQRGRFDRLAIRTRTVISILRFLAQSVVVPKEHVDLGIVEAEPDGADPTLFRVRVSRRRPKEASIRVHYRGHWFYVSDSDLSSKSTFFILATVLLHENSSSESDPSGAPVLTLPVGN